MEEKEIKMERGREEAGENECVTCTIIPLPFPLYCPLFSAG